LILPEEKRDFITVPSNWNGHVVRSKTLERKLGTDGYATYQLKIKMNKSRMLAFRIPYEPSSYKLYLNNSLISETGKAGSNEQNENPERSLKYIEFQSDSLDVNITLLISNFHSNYAGFINTIKFGLSKDINQFHLNNVAIDLLVTGILFIMGVYHLSLYYLHRTTFF
jgi:hypothetical protein